MVGIYLPVIGYPRLSVFPRMDTGIGFDPIFTIRGQTITVPSQHATVIGIFERGEFNTILAPWWHINNCITVLAVRLDLNDPVSEFIVILNIEIVVAVNCLQSQTGKPLLRRWCWQ